MQTFCDVSLQLQLLVGCSGWLVVLTLNYPFYFSEPPTIIVLTLFHNYLFLEHHITLQLTHESCLIHHAQRDRERHEEDVKCPEICGRRLNDQLDHLKDSGIYWQVIKTV